MRVALRVSREVRQCPLLGRCCPVGKQRGSVSVRFWVDVALWVNREGAVSVRFWVGVALQESRDGASLSVLGSVLPCG